MSGLAGASLIIAAVCAAAAPQKRHFEWLVAGGLLVLGWLASTLTWGPLIGSIVAMVVVMTAASMLVLVIAPRPTSARPLAIAAAALAAVAWGVFS